VLKSYSCAIKNEVHLPNFKVNTRIILLEIPMSYTVEVPN